MLWDCGRGGCTLLVSKRIDWIFRRRSEGDQAYRRGCNQERKPGTEHKWPGSRLDSIGKLGKPHPGQIDRNGHHEEIGECDKLDKISGKKRDETGPGRAQDFTNTDFFGAL